MNSVANDARTITSQQPQDGAEVLGGMSRRHFMVFAGAMTGGALCGGRPAVARQATPAASPVSMTRDWRSERWVGTWAAAMHEPSAGFGEEFPSQFFEFDKQTVRQIVRTSVGGDQVRVRLANTFGDVPLVIGAARLALRDSEVRIDPASDRVLTFSGSPSISIPPGALAVSDPVSLAVPAFSELAVSMYFPEPTTSTSVHAFAFQTNYFSPVGDFTAEAAMPVETTAQAWVFLTGIDVTVAEPTGVVVALGDSITDGALSTPDTNQRWPDLLAERLAAEKDEPATAVLNVGIGGNRVLGNPPEGFEFAGPNALARFDRDVLAHPGVTHLIVFEGINDIGLPTITGDPTEFVSADALVAGLRQLAERAHEHGIVVIGATITPSDGSMVFSEEGEAIRQSVNDWIRIGGAFDAVLDFDVVVRDPTQPTRLLPAFDSGDLLHPNDAGFAAMADSIDLALLRT
ncbi:MAG TPA: SGNH/GDSL hydrolase family protein [Thermomicrobiales bacterium]|nr:SGNH/GDSL hydrolase family protein [Thermomicrobiales bacterium]